MANKHTPQTVEMELLKGTKRTWVYGSDTAEGICSQVYLSKEYLPEPPPPTITLVVSWKEGK